ncbi:MAG: hypothetical protein J6C52_10020, partial [Clostridia bacterium]|nr:hypothetical protein [Clostridia bacterium]
MKRYISIALFLAILVSLTACGGTSGAGTGDVTTAADDTTAEVVKDIYADLPTADHGGLEINVFGYASSESYGDKEYLVAEQTGEVVDDALFARNSETEERLGVKINFTLADSDKNAISQFNASVMAGDAEYDIFAIKSYALGSILSAGSLRPWDGIKGINYDKPWYIHDANETMTFGGKTYGIFSDACGTNITMCW